MKEKGVREKENKDLELNKLSVEEVRARNRELAQMKSILFYQEQKNKRINKIKSKKYRKIHKKAEEKRKAEELQKKLALVVQEQSFPWDSKGNIRENYAMRMISPANKKIEKTVEKTEKGAQ